MSNYESDDTQVPEVPDPAGAGEDQDGLSGRIPSFNVDSEYSDDYLSDTYDSEKYRANHNLIIGLSKACGEYYELYPQYARLRSLDLTLIKVGDKICLTKHVQTVTIESVIQERIKFKVRTLSGQEMVATKGALLVPVGESLVPGTDVTLISKNLVVQLMDDPGDGVVTIQLPGGEEILSARSGLSPINKLSDSITDQELSNLYCHARQQVAADNPGYQELEFYLLFCEYFRTDSNLRTDSVTLLDALPHDIYLVILKQLRSRMGTRPTQARGKHANGEPDRLF